MLSVGTVALVLGGSPAFGPSGSLPNGPGAGAWVTASPESHGLSSTLLQKAAAAVQIRVPERYCLVVAKDGKLVHEDYYANTSSTVYETDSLAKTATALVVGAAIHAGLFDLDTPLVHYGVAPTCFDPTDHCWQHVGECPKGMTCPTGPDGWFPNVTARALLGQSGGCVEGVGCMYPPGTAWTYDSGEYIQHLSLLITATAKQPAKQWVTNNFMAKIGLPYFYTGGDGYPEDNASGEITCGGGMLVNCRDAARLGQIILDRGVVRHADGTVERLIDESYIAEMLTPQFPARGYSYGLLTWLNAKRDPAKSPPCCAPRWGPTSTCVGKKMTLPLLGDGIADVAPHDVGIGMGWLGQYLYVVPSRNLTIVSMGSSWGSSLQCPLGAALPTDPAYNDGYDDAFSATELWLQIDKATRGTSHLPPPPPPPTAPANATNATVATAPPLALVSAPGSTAHAGGQKRSSKGAHAPLVGAVANSSGGSCSCRCPPGRLTGRCYDLPPSVSPADGPAACAAVLGKAAVDCPAIGVVRQCNKVPTAADENCSAVGGSMRGDIGSTTVWGGHVECTLARRCSSDTDEETAFFSAACRCQPVKYGDYGCSYSPEPCVYSGYMLPGSV